MLLRCLFFGESEHAFTGGRALCNSENNGVGAAWPATVGNYCKKRKVTWTREKRSRDGRGARSTPCWSWCRPSPPPRPGEHMRNWPFFRAKRCRGGGGGTGGSRVGVLRERGTPRAAYGTPRLALPRLCRSAGLGASARSLPIMTEKALPICIVIWLHCCRSHTLPARSGSLIGRTLFCKRCRRRAVELRSAKQRRH